MRKILFALLIVACAIVSLRFAMAIPKKEKPAIGKTIGATAEKRLALQLSQMKTFLKENPKYNSDVVFFLDMKLPSHKNRFFVYDLRKDSITDSGLVAHGSGSETGIVGKLKFSNVPNSLCTSLGKYSIGSSYNGEFGKAYKLYGLDETNSKAFERAIVLHKYDTMPYDENQSVPNSFGCPMVSVKYYDRLQKIIDGSGKPVILSIYY